MSKADVMNDVGGIGESSSKANDLFYNMPQNAIIRNASIDYFGLQKSRPTRESVLKRLSEALMRRSLTKIDLSQRGLHSTDARLVKFALLQNSKLSVLKLGYNNLGDEGTKTLAEGIVAHKALTSLDLGFNHIGDEGCNALAKAVDSSCLETLYLAGNHIGEDGAIALADAIRKGCALRKLHLTGNRLGPEGVRAITEAIVETEIRQREAHGYTTKGISELFLGGTSMGPGGSRSVARMLEMSSTICVISLTNCSLGDDEIGVLAASLKSNRENLPLESLQLSFNDMTCKGLDLLTNAIWGSRTLRELLLDNNEIGDRGGQQIANILPHLKTLEIVDVGFNKIKAHGMKALMKVVATTQHLVSLSVSGNPIDTGAAKAVAYALAYNRSLRSLFLDNCLIEHEGQRHIVAGFVSNSGIALRKLTGFLIGPVIITIGLPPALEHWTNEQVLNFIHLMWEKTAHYNDEKVEEKELDPLHFLNDSSRHNGKAVEPLDANTVVDVANRAFASLGENGEDVFSRNLDPSFESPLTVDAIIIESNTSTGEVSIERLEALEKDVTSSDSKTDDSPLLVTGPWLNYGSKSFIATPAEPAQSAIPDPQRKKRIVDWLCSNIKHLNELSQQRFNPGELWRLHQHYFTPVVNESGGSVGSASLNLSEENFRRIVNSVPDVGRRNFAEVNSVTPSTQSSQEALSVPLSDPSLPASPAALPMLKRKVSYRCLGDAMLYNTKTESRVRDQSVAKMIEDGAVSQFIPPRNKRARRNKTRISFLPRIKSKLDSHLDVCHEKALILMRQLEFVEKALLSGNINPNDGCPSTHLAGILASEAEMILVDMM